MARQHRRRDVLAAAVIVGVALVYWMKRGGPGISFDDREAPQVRAASVPSESVGDLPGLRRGE